MHILLDVTALCVCACVCMLFSVSRTIYLFIFVFSECAHKQQEWCTYKKLKTSGQKNSVKQHAQEVTFERTRAQCKI